FPFIFRGALDVGATEINDAMKLACVKALAHLARAPVAAEAQRAYRDETLIFGREYLIPKPFDPRLLSTVSSAVARAAMDSGVATRPIDNFQSYTSELDRYVYRSGLLMRPIFDRARRARRRVVFAEGEDDRVLQAATALLEDGFETPALIGRPRVIEVRAKRLGLPITAEGPVEIVNPEDDPRYPDYWRTYLQAAERDGVSPDRARAVIRTNPTAIGAVMVSRGEADTLICGAVGRFADHLRHIELVLGRDRRMGGVDHRRAIGALSAIVLDSGPVFIADTHVNPDPSAEQLVDIACAGAGELRRFGIEPRIAFVSHSNFGDARSPSSEKMREAVRLMDAAPRGFEYEGEMNADAALDSEICERIFPNSRLRRPANLLIMPNIDAANATKSALKVLANGLQVGPVLLGLDGQAHVVTASITARGVINAAALAAAGAGRRA
ncbi:MAG: phosphate acyltransferase, partial [Pseudomonadota bacterium]